MSIGSVFSYEGSERHEDDGLMEIQQQVGLACFALAQGLDESQPACPLDA